MMVNQNSFTLGDLEIYNYHPIRSENLLDYSEFLHRHPEANSSALTELESLYVTSKYDSPVTLWGH